MDKRVMRERMRRKRRQMRIRKLMRLGTYAVAAILLLIFIVRGVILPIARRIGGENAEKTVEVQAETAEADPNAAVRRPLKGQGDTGKVAARAEGWHEDEKGFWYQNADGTYYAGGFQEIEGERYCFDENGYLQTGWVSKGVRDYYFREDGTYDPDKKRKMLALTFDDGPGPYTDRLLDCLEENHVHATFFMLGTNVKIYPDTVKRMAALGCEIGSHSWDHQNLTTLTLEGAAKQYRDTDDALIQACGQAATVARAPYGSWSQDVVNAVEKPFILWSMDSRDWEYKDADKTYDSVINGDLSDGSIILLHDIHQTTVEAVERLVPELVAQGFKLVTVSEMAEAKDVELQYASYTDFWDSSFAAGRISGCRKDY